MKISSIPKSGRKGSVVYVNSRHGKVAREYVRPSNPRTSDQQLNRNQFGAVSRRWGTLTSEQHAAWRVATANGVLGTLGPWSVVAMSSRPCARAARTTN